MAALDQAEANRLANASLKGVAYVAPTTPTRLALYTVAGTAAATGTELTAGAGTYARQDLSTTALPTPTNGSTTSTAAVSYTNMPAATIVAVEIWDSNGTPRRAWFATITSKTTVLGDTITFASGSITASIA